MLNYDIKTYFGSFEVIKEYGVRLYIRKDGRHLLYWSHRGKRGLNELWVDFEIINYFYVTTNSSRKDILKRVSEFFVQNEDEITVNMAYETSPENFPINEKDR